MVLNEEKEITFTINGKEEKKNVICKQISKFNQSGILTHFEEHNGIQDTEYDTKGNIIHQETINPWTQEEYWQSFDEDNKWLSTKSKILFQKNDDDLDSELENEEEATEDFSDMEEEDEKQVDINTFEKYGFVADELDNLEPPLNEYEKDFVSKMVTLIPTADGGRPIQDGEVEKVAVYDNNKNLIAIKKIKNNEEKIVESYEYKDRKLFCKKNSHGSVFYAYDSKGNVIHKKSYYKGKIEKDIKYEYDEAGNLTREYNQYWEKLTSYFYDKNNNLIKKISCGEDGIEKVFYEAKYDDAGNILYKKEYSNTITYEYNSDNQLIHELHLNNYYSDRTVKTETTREYFDDKNLKSEVVVQTARKHDADSDYFYKKQETILSDDQKYELFIFSHMRKTGMEVHTRLREFIRDENGLLSEKYNYVVFNNEEEKNQKYRMMWLIEKK